MCALTGHDKAGNKEVFCFQLRDNGFLVSRIGELGYVLIEVENHFGAVLVLGDVKTICILLHFSTSQNHNCQLALVSQRLSGQAAPTYLLAEAAVATGVGAIT